MKTKNLCSLTDEVLLNFFLIFMDDGTTAKTALSNTVHTGSLNYNTSEVMKKECGNKIRAREILPLPNTSTNCY